MLGIFFSLMTIFRNPQSVMHIPTEKKILSFMNDSCPILPVVDSFPIL